MSITVTASWIFNRLCDEPDRMKKEFNKRMTGRPISSFDAFRAAQIDYENILSMEAQIAEMRLKAHPDIQVVHDTAYIVVAVK